MLVQEEVTALHGMMHITRTATLQSLSNLQELSECYVPLGHVLCIFEVLQVATRLLLMQRL